MPVIRDQLGHSSLAVTATPPHWHLRLPALAGQRLHSIRQRMQLSRAHAREDHSPAVTRNGPVVNRTVNINNMITGGSPGACGHRPAIVEKGVAKPACLATGAGPFFYRPRFTVAPPIS
jgi:hypothetical protein